MQGTLASAAAALGLRAACGPGTLRDAAVAAGGAWRAAAALYGPFLAAPLALASLRALSSEARGVGSTSAAPAAPATPSAPAAAPAAPSASAAAQPTAPSSPTAPPAVAAAAVPAAPAAAAAAVSSRALHVDGQRAADPGESRYTAPYWVPPDVRTTHRLPRVLFSDPWPAAEDPALRRAHAALCLQQLRAAGRPLTVEEVHDAANRAISSKKNSNSNSSSSGGGTSVGTSSSSGALDAGAAAPPPPPPLVTLAYTKQLLEHMRRTRLVFGKKNPSSPLSAGHPQHPRLYGALPYQAERRGLPEVLAAADEAARARAVDKALRRLHNGKPPYPIHRRRARYSAWHHEQLQEELRAVL